MPTRYQESQGSQAVVVDWTLTRGVWTSTHKLFHRRASLFFVVGLDHKIILTAKFSQSTYVSYISGYVFLACSLMLDGGVCTCTYVCSYMSGYVFLTCALGLVHVEHELLDNLHEVLLVHHPGDEVQGSQANGVITVIQALHNQISKEDHALTHYTLNFIF